MPATDEPIDVPTVPAVVTQLSPSVRDSAGTRSLTMEVAGGERRRDGQAGEDFEDAQQDEIVH